LALDPSRTASSFPDNRTSSFRIHPTFIGVCSHSELAKQRKRRYRNRKKGGFAGEAS
jgi:hypothetical protein